jgi:hypothetical protein
MPIEDFPARRYSFMTPYRKRGNSLTPVRSATAKVSACGTMADVRPSQGSGTESIFIGNSLSER